METTKTKKARKPRAAKAANSPEPVATPAQEELTTRTVRYCGPTSHPSHHHAAVAAEGSRHVWAAPIIAGLAIILTATIAYSAVQANSEQVNTMRETELRGDYVKGIRDINQRLDKIEQRLNTVQGAVTAE